MLADDAANIFAIGSSFAAETGRVSGYRNGKTIFFQSLVAIEIRQGNFSSRNQPQVMFLKLEQVAGKLRQISGAVHGGRIYRVGRQHLGVAMLFRMKIKHEVREGSLEFRT